MPITNRARPLPLSTIDSSAITGSLQAVNGTGFEYPVFQVYLINDTDQAVTVSFDGATDEEYVPAGDTRSIRAIETAHGNVLIPLFAKGQVISVRGTAGSGTFAISAYTTNR